MRTKYVGFLGLSIVALGALGWRYWHSPKSVVVVIPSYNNAEWYDKNLSSVFAQDYANYSVIYIDDKSSDNTYQLVTQKVAASGKQKQVKVIGNEQRKGALANIYNAIHTHCSDKDIVVLLDGDDWFKHENVLSTVVRAYDDANILMTYGQYEEYPSGRIGQCQAIPRTVIEAHAYRKYPWVTSHLRTFYAGLFKKIKKEDFMYQGDFFTVTWDMAILFPMLEMAAGRWKFIEDVLYVYNMATPLNDYKTKFELQQMCHYYIRHQPPYAALS